MNKASDDDNIRQFWYDFEGLETGLKLVLVISDNLKPCLM